MDSSPGEGPTDTVIQIAFLLYVLYVTLCMQIAGGLYLVTALREDDQERGTVYKHQRTLHAH